MKVDLTNQVAVVTGGSGQLGRVIVRTLASCGADVAIHYRNNRDKAESLAGEVRAMGRRAMIAAGDVGTQADVQSLRDAVRKEFGDADIIVNNAVTQYPWTTVLEQSIEDYESQFRTCVLHNVLMAKAFVPGMIKKGRGRVIAINTECAMQNLPSQSAYVAGKRGMDGVLRVLAREVGSHQVTVNQVAPGWMISDKYRANAEDPGAEYAKGVPLRRRGEDQDIANAVAFLASDLAGFITGCYLPVCGGNVMPTI